LFCTQKNDFSKKLVFCTLSSEVGEFVELPKRTEHTSRKRKHKTFGMQKLKLEKNYR
jgi:hypothetical protein